MCSPSASTRRHLTCAFLLAVLLLEAACSKQPVPPAETQQAAKQDAPSPSISSDGLPTTAAPATSSKQALSLPMGFKRETGDLDSMAKRHEIRALIILNPIGFFYDRGQPKGAMYETLTEFQKFANRKLKTGKIPITVTFLPMRGDQIQKALTEGIGDIVAYGVVVTPEREKVVAFSTPMVTDVKQVVVTGSALGPVSTLADLGGKEVYVNPITTYFQNLQKANEDLKQAGKAPILIREADKNLTDDDLVQMVNAGMIPATITIQQRADLWSQVLPHIKSHPDIVIATDQKLAWAMRKDNPQLKQLVDEFIGTHAVGTSFGNTLLRRYLQNTKWVKDATSPEEMKKFQEDLALFKKYSGEYDFDVLMIAALAYQESMLNQSMRNPSGAIGIMQVIPKNAAASPINIPSVTTIDANIHAGVKMLRMIEDTYLNDPNLDRLNKTLFAFASYNAGPNRIVKLRKKAGSMGLDPNVWFGNVELVAAKDIGQETVTYVSNIYKYYVAYTLASEQNKLRAVTTSSPAK